MGRDVGGRGGVAGSCTALGDLQDVDLLGAASLVR